MVMQVTTRTYRPLRTMVMVMAIAAAYCIMGRLGRSCTRAMRLIATDLAQAVCRV
jgi:hypothetical protein